MRAIGPLVTAGILTLVFVAANRTRIRGKPRNPKASAAMHRVARETASEAFRSVVGIEPTSNELRVLEAVSLHETTFGHGWKGEGVGSYNMGAIQADKAWTGETFTYTDSKPTDTGAQIRYEQAFRKYPNALAGWKDLVRELYVRRSSVRRAAQSGDPLAVAKAMYMTQYYGGFGATAEQRIRGYAQALADSLLEINKAEK
jgi:hypothetical protein